MPALPAAFALAHFEQRLIRSAMQPLAGDCSHIVLSGSAHHVGGAPAEILVELEFHAAFSVGTGMIRSRAVSAPYAIAASTSSCVSPGYCSKISASVMPSARKSRISETQIRVPFTHGLPPQILGSMEIRSSRGFTSLPHASVPFAAYHKLGNRSVSHERDSSGAGSM
jgi:hypothetical protein